MFNHKTKTVAFAALILGISNLLSRFLGLIRDRLLAGNFGAGPELDAYFAAFRIPDFIFAILVLGGISAAFIPVFSENFKSQNGQDQEQENKWPEKASNFTNNLLNSFLILIIALCGILAIFSPFLVHLIVPGFSESNKEITSTLTRIMFLSPIFFGISSIFSGILQYFNRFLAYSLAPLLYNLGIIFGILVLTPVFGIYGLAFGVILGAFLHFSIQLPAAIKAGYKYKFLIDLKSQGLQKIFKLMIPRILGTGAEQINLVLVTIIASLLGAGSIAVFNFSNNLYYFPVALFGVSFAVSSFPVLSKFLANGQKKEFQDRFSSSFRHIIFFTIPISFIIFLLRAQLIRLILGTGKFGWEQTRLTAACLGIFCLGILAESLIPLIARAFFSFHDTKTPVIIGIITIILAISLSFLFVYLLSFQNYFSQAIIIFLKLQGIGNIGVVGLPLGLSLASVFHFVTLLIFLNKKTEGIDWHNIWIFSKKVLAAGVIMSFFIYLTLYIVASFVNMQTFFGVLTQTFIACTVAMIVYIVIGRILKLPQANMIKSLFFDQLIKRLI